MFALQIILFDSRLTDLFLQSKAPAAITDTPQVTLTPDGKVQLPNATSLTEEQKQAVAKIEEELAVLRRSIGSTD
jgi:hypothetical protein